MASFRVEIELNEIVTDAPFAFGLGGGHSFLVADGTNSFRHVSDGFLCMMVSN